MQYNEEDIKALFDEAKSSKYKIGCGKVLGHGERCVPERLCDACEHIEKLQKKIEKLEKKTETKQKK